MKGILLAGGAGSRLYPCTAVTNKHLLAVYDKPMIYYPLSILMLAGIKEILIISSPRDIGCYKGLLGDGRHLGMDFSYAVQDTPGGIAQAFIIGDSFIGGETVCLALGDNIFHGRALDVILQRALRLKEGALVFGCRVKDPRRYGVADLDSDGTICGIEEKPESPRSNLAIPGLYFYDNKVVDIARWLQPSRHGEMDITDINREYLSRGKLRVEVLGSGIAWFDTGTPESLLAAASYTAAYERRRGQKIACIEEIAYKQGLIGSAQLKSITHGMPDSPYKSYLNALLWEVQAVDR
jgi:glucose-1-phosphate thymidylyltransferase